MLQNRCWITGAQGIVLGLFLSRLVAESSTVAWKTGSLLLLVVASLAVGLVLMVWLGRRVCCAWPVLLLLGYILWPWAAPRLGWMAGFVVAALLLGLQRPKLPAGPWPEVAVLLGALALYLGTLAPTVLPADAGEFQLVCAVLGIAHPPGYPLYTLLGKLFTLLPVGDPAYRVNLFAAVCGALTLAVVARSVRRGTGSVAAALLAAGALGLSTTFWAQSTTANIRSLTALFTALTLALLLHWGQTRSPRAFLAAGICFGLGAGHHSSFVLLGVPFLVYVLLCEPRLLLQPRRWGPPLLACLATGIVLLYLPLRSRLGAPFDPEPIRSWADFINHVLARGFRGDLFYFRTWPELLARLEVWRQIMGLQFGPVLLGGMALAALCIWRHDRRALALLVGTWAVNTLAALTYRAPQTVEYLLPSYVALTLLLGHGAGVALRLPGRRAVVVVGLAAALALGIILNGARNYPSFQELHRDTSTRDRAEAILRDAPPQAMVLANWHWATPLWYLQWVEGERPDVTVRYVYPEGATPNEEVWLRRIAQELEARPVVLTNYFYAFAQTDYRWIPFHGAWLVRRELLTDPPQAITPCEATFEQGIRLLGYRLEAETFAPGETVRLLVFWQVTASLARDYASFAQLLGPDGVVGQGDIGHRSSGYVPGEVRVDAYRLALLPHTPPGEYRLITGFYDRGDAGWQRLLAEGRDHVPLATVSIAPARQPAATLHPLSCAFEGGLRLTGVDYDRSVAGQLRLYLHFSCSAPTGALGVQALRGGQVIAQGNLAALPAGAASTLALDVPDGPEPLFLRLATPQGRTLARLGPWHWPLGAGLRLRPPQGAVHYVPLGGEMVFTGFGRLGSEASRGQTLWLRPCFLAARPLSADYTVSVGLAQDSWECKTDGTPALGAIPTLKWVRGWLVEDAHLLALPADAPTGILHTVLTVYDAFTLAPLPILDERLVRQGQGIRLELDTVRVR